MPKIIPVATFDCVVFGGTGDLTLRKLLPALYYRLRDGQMPPESPHHRRAALRLTDDDYRQRAAQGAARARRRRAISTPTSSTASCAQLHYVADRCHRRRRRLGARCARLLDPKRVRVFYLATVARPLRPDLPQRSAPHGWSPSSRAS